MGSGDGDLIPASYRKNSRSVLFPKRSRKIPENNRKKKFLCDVIRVVVKKFKGETDQRFRIPFNGYSGVFLAMRSLAEK
jgi:hypothetical protein